MIKLNGVIPEKADMLIKTFPEMIKSLINLEDGLVDVYIPSTLELAINYNQVDGLLQFIAWDDVNKSVVLTQDEFVRFAIV